MVNFEEEKAITIDLLEEESIQTEVMDINYIPSYKAAELERQANEKERIAYYNEIQQKVANGEFNGKDGKDGKDGVDGKDGKDGEKGDIGDTGYTLTNTLRGESITIEDAVEYKLLNLEIDGKSVQDGETGEIESVGYTNLIPTNESEWEQGTINGGNNENNTTRLRTKDYIDINDNTLHTFRLENALIGNVWFYDEQKQVVNNLYDMIYKTGMKSIDFTTPKNTKYYKVVIRYEDNSVITSQAISEIKPMLEKGSIAHSYIPFSKYGIEVKITNGTDTNTTVLELNETLRSLPNGVKDKAYIKNNKLYVDRYIANDSELTTPVTEEVGDCVIYTYAGVNNIDLEAGLKTEFSVTYAQDMKSILKDYPSMEEIQEYVDNLIGTINKELASLTTLGGE